MSLYPKSPIFTRLLDQIELMPVIDCHEHFTGPEARPTYKEPISALTQMYLWNDLASAGYGYSLSDFQKLADVNISTDEKWPLYQKLWRATEHTAYARVTKMVLKNVYGESQMTRAALDRVAEKLAGMDEAMYFRIIEEAGIQAMLVDVLAWLPGGMESFLDGQKTFPSRFFPLIPLPEFHPVKLDWTVIQRIGGMAGKHITSLDEFLEAAFMAFQRFIEKGAVGLKDQSAYERTISYDLVPRADAERLMNCLLSDPRASLGWPESKPLNDYLFHSYMRFARQLKLPVQVHTGLLAGQYDRVNKANAIQLAPVLELHREVRFDLFHGNWPYLSDLLFLGKNYPNVTLDLCWLHIIDPAYAIDLLERATLTMPHTKIHAFGGDYSDIPEFTVAHLQIARQNIAAALTNLIEGGWLEEEEAICLAKDWLFNNPNRFFNLGFKDIQYS
ncbi:MAG: hypothetical protein EHM70_17095 [Chloroflexota bacterium]|nr:MAG: hypothetical protein EHM70_17095 [Chloroflexota bacterium]